MSSPLACEIRKLVETARNTKDVECLISICRSVPKRDRDSVQNYAQKCAETEIAVSNSKTTNMAYSLSLVAIVGSMIITITSILSPDSFEKYSTFYNFSRVVLFVLLVISAGLFFHELIGKRANTLKNIILAIEDEKLVKNISSEEEIPPSE